MSEPIQNKPSDVSSTPNSHPAEEGEQLTKVAAVALGALGSPRLPSAPLDPTRVELAVPQSFKWLWNFKGGDKFIEWETESKEEEIHKINVLQYPVLQPTVQYLGKVTDFDADNLIPYGGGFIDSQKFLRLMGFSLSFGKFKTPTREQFVINYNMFRAQNLQFPELVFSMADKILDPDEFVAELLEKDLILSDGQELIHDYTYHTIPTLQSIFKAPEFYRPYKDLLGKTVRTFQEFLKLKPSEILTKFNAELNESKERPITESDLRDIIATLEFMVGAALDILSGLILDYKDILEKGDAQGGVYYQFLTNIIYTLNNDLWKKNLQKSVPSLKKDFLENYPNEAYWEAIIIAIFKTTH